MASMEIDDTLFVEWVDVTAHIFMSYRANGDHGDHNVGWKALCRCGWSDFPGGTTIENVNTAQKKHFDEEMRKASFTAGNR